MPIGGLNPFKRIFIWTPQIRVNDFSMQILIRAFSPWSIENPSKQQPRQTTATFPFSTSSAFQFYSQGSLIQHSAFKGDSTVSKQNSNIVQACNLHCWSDDCWWDLTLLLPRKLVHSTGSTKTRNDHTRADLKQRRHFL